MSEHQGRSDRSGEHTEMRGAADDFALFAEAFCAGFLARKHGLDDADGEAYMAGLMEAFRNSGSQKARRVVEAMQIASEPGERDAEHWG